MGRSPIACRTASYDPFEPVALEHLAGLGICHVEIAVPASDKIAQTKADLERYGLSATSLHGECDVARDDIAEQVERQMPAFEALGARIMFVSVKAGAVPRETAYARLRQAGDVAARHDVTIALETHPDLITDGAVGRRTIEAVAHPNVRINFDTANVYFYGHDIDAAQELRRVIPHVASVHLKDTDGGHRHWYFPALGRGVVDFRAIFRVLDEAGFTGPCTLEIEGIEGEAKTERLICDRIAESVGFLRGLGRL